ncbi:uncharacterized protein FFNC_15571 [Fusarium fujikuroi]|nr:uncharacterized protein FFNC_15571 [Fusarium fujikuroi]
MADAWPSASETPERTGNYSTPVLPVSSCISTGHGEELRSEAAGDTIVVSLSRKAKSPRQERPKKRIILHTPRDKPGPKSPIILQQKQASSRTKELDTLLISEDGAESGRIGKLNYSRSCQRRRILRKDCNGESPCDPCNSRCLTKFAERLLLTVIRFWGERL